MKQSHIKALLNEAARTTDLRRAYAICETLKEAVYPDPEKAILQNFVESLYVRTIERHKEYLPKLFPAFALLCGDRAGLIGSVDWSLVD